MSFSYKITWKTQIICVGLSIVIMLLLWPLYWNSVVTLFSSNIIYFPTKFKIVNAYIYIAAIISLLVILHEGLHGLAFKLYGGKVRFGIRHLNPYTLEISGLKLNRSQFLIVLLTPITVISLLTIFIPGITGKFLFMFDLISSTGDFFMAFILAGCKPGYKIKDSKYGIEIIK